MPEVSPTNSSHLTVNTVPTSSRAGFEQPFVYDRGTKTIHIGNPGGGHAQIVGRTPLQGPTYNGVVYPEGTLEWYSAPNIDESQAVSGTLEHHLGYPITDERLAFDPPDEDEFKLGFTQLFCHTCGDAIDGPDCPRCDWGSYNHSDDNTKNPRDPTIDMHRGIQSTNQFGRVIPPDRWFWSISDAEVRAQEPYWDF